MPKKSVGKFKEQKEKKQDFRIYGVRKEEEFVTINRNLPEPFKPLFEKNGGAMMLVGGMGSGKGVTLSNFFLREEFFGGLFTGGLYFISPTAKSDLTNVHLVREADFVSTEYSDQLMDGIYDNIMNIPPEDRELSAIILDDCLGSIRQHSSMNRITSTVRHMKSLLVYSLQACKGLPPTIRSNISLTIIYYTPSNKQMNDLIEMHSHMGGEDMWVSCYNEATSKKYQFMVNCFKTMRIFKWGGQLSEPILLYSMYDENGSRTNQSFLSSNDVGTLVESIQEDTE
tara:strand:- start:414 stop:1265 length:852 start_codon:yes stop_codon:yes gene_type:complete